MRSPILSKAGRSSARRSGRISREVKYGSDECGDLHFLAGFHQSHEQLSDERLPVEA